MSWRQHLTCPCKPRWPWHDYVCKARCMDRTFGLAPRAAPPHGLNGGRALRRGALPPVRRTPRSARLSSACRRASAAGCSPAATSAAICAAAAPAPWRQAMNSSGVMPMQLAHAWMYGLMSAAPWPPGRHPAASSPAPTHRLSRSASTHAKPVASCSGSRRINGLGCKHAMMRRARRRTGDVALADVMAGGSSSLASLHSAVWSLASMLTKHSGNATTRGSGQQGRTSPLVLPPP